MLTVDCQRNTNEKHSQVLLCTCQNGHPERTKGMGMMAGSYTARTQEARSLKDHEFETDLSYIVRPIQLSIK